MAVHPHSGNHNDKAWMGELLPECKQLSGMRPTTEKGKESKMSTRMKIGEKNPRKSDEIERRC